MYKNANIFRRPCVLLASYSGLLSRVKTNKPFLASYIVSHLKKFCLPSNFASMSAPQEVLFTFYLASWWFTWLPSIWLHTIYGSYSIHPCFFMLYVMIVSRYILSSLATQNLVLLSRSSVLVGPRRSGHPENAYWMNCKV